MSHDVTRLAARRIAAQARNARRQADADEAFEATHAHAADDADMASSSSVRMIGTALDLSDTRGGGGGGSSAAAASASALQSAHDQRRAINSRIYGRLNVVEDGAAFEPQKFVSSRTAKAKAAAAAAAAAAGEAAAATAAASASTGVSAASSSRVQRVEDFMDDEDLADGQAGGAGATSGAGLATRAAFKRPTASSAASDSGGLFVAPASQGSIALHMLKAMGWRVGGAAKKKARVYGAALPPGMGGSAAADDEASAAEDEASALRSMMSTDEADVALYATREKNDTYGLGHTPYSQLNAAARNQHADAGYAPMTFVRAKQLTPEALAVAQPKVYTIEVPDSFNCRHVFPVQEQAWQVAPSQPQTQPPVQTHQPAPAAPSQLPLSQQQQSRLSNALITDWQGKMDASRRALVESLPRLPLPPMPPPSSFAAPGLRAAEPAASLSAPVASAPAPGVSALDLQRQRRLEAMAASEQGARPAFGRMQNQQPQYPAAAAAAAPEHQPGRIDIRAAIAAAAEKAAAMRAEREAEQRKAERRSKWGPLPPEAAAVDATQFPLAAAFLSANFGEAPPQLPASLPALPLPPPPPPASAAPAFTVPPSLSALFPKFVVAGVQDPASGASSAATSSDTAAAASSSTSAKDDAMMDKFAPASSSTDAAASTAPGAAAAAAPSDPSSTGPYASYFAAARLKMYGKLTRRVEEWTPHNLVYKRFGVPPPAGNKQHFAATQQRNSSSKTSASAAVKAAAAASSAGDSVPGFPSFVLSSTPFGSVSDPSSAAASAVAVHSAAPVLSVAQIQAEIAREEEEAIKAELARDDQEEQQPRQQGGAQTDAPESKPSLDLFRAIFEASDDEAESAPSSLKHKKSSAAAARKPQTQPATQQQLVTAPPAFASAAAKSTPSSLVDSIFGSSASRPSTAAPPVSSGFVHPDRLRQVPSAVAAAPFASSSSARPSARDVITLEDDSEDAEMGITGFSQKPSASASAASAAAAAAHKFVPAGFRSASKPVQFVPASGKPGKSGAAAASAANSRGDRFGGGESGSYGEDDDAYGGSSSSAPFSALRGGLAPLAPAGSMESSFRRDPSRSRRALSPDPAPVVLQQFLPPPVAAPRVAPALPPAVPQSWPFAPQFGGGGGGGMMGASRAAEPAAAHRPSGAAAPAPRAPAAAAASAPASASAAADSSTLLSQLLDLHKALKSSKKHSSSSHSHSHSKEEGSSRAKKERKESKKDKHKSSKKHSKTSKSKKHRSRSRSRSRSKHHKRESKAHDSSSSSSDDSDVEVINIERSSKA